MKVWTLNKQYFFKKDVQEFEQYLKKEEAYELVRKGEGFHVGVA